MMKVSIMNAFPECLVIISTFLIIISSAQEHQELSQKQAQLPTQTPPPQYSGGHRIRLLLQGRSAAEPERGNSVIIIATPTPVSTKAPEHAQDQQTAPQTSSPLTSKSAEAIINSTSARTTATTLATPTTKTTTTTTPLSAKTTTATADNSWIESILIHVEDLNLNHQDEQSNLERKQQPTDDVAEDSDEGDFMVASASSPSEAPTDSGEDPLEATTLSSASSSNVQLKPETHEGGSDLGSTQYSIASDDSIDDQELRLVDSNNVSAVIISSQVVGASNNVNQIQDRDAAATSVGPSEGDKLVQTSPKQPIGCEQAYTRCALRKVCAPALRAYNDDCQDLINNRTSQCSSKCLKAMIALRSSEEGDDLVNCDCQGNEYCQRSKQTSLTCRPQVEQAVDPKTVVACSTASWICLADQLCSTALDYYYRNCQSLFSQRHCSMRCNNSLSILYRQPKASKLINCQCDGSEEFPCVKYKTYTERLCLNKQPSTQMEADDQQEEAEGFNLTNDPETNFHLGSASSSSFNPVGGQYDDQNEEEDSTGAAVNTNGAVIVEESSSIGFNGIQSMEDNWIPLMSGRFFNNRHQQQRAQQLQQQQQQLTQNKQHQPSQVGQQQQHRKAPKNVKQKSRSSGTNSAGYHDGRRKYTRTMMFLSSGSSSFSKLDVRLAFVLCWQALLFLLIFNKCPIRVS